MKFTSIFFTASAVVFSMFTSKKLKVFITAYFGVVNNGAKGSAFWCCIVSIYRKATYHNG